MKPNKETVIIILKIWCALTKAGLDATDRAINDISVTPPGANDIKSVMGVITDKYWRAITNRNASMSIEITDINDNRVAVQRIFLSIPKNLAPKLVPIMT